jgi:hypothetical protein
MQSVKSKPIASPLAFALTLCAVVTTPVSLAATTSSGQQVPVMHGNLNAAQLVEMNQRVALAQTIVNNIAADAQAKGIGDTWQIRELSMLYNTRSSVLSTIANTAATVDEVHAQVIAAKSRALADRAPTRSADGAAPKLLGSTTDNLVFYPQTLCRYIDTRVVGGPIGTASPRIFELEGSGSTYGGDPGCNVGNYPYLAANVTITVSGGAAGFLTIRAVGSTQNTSFINWPTGGTPGVANAGIIAATTTTFPGAPIHEFEAIAGGNTPQMIVDVFGAFDTAEIQDYVAFGDLLLESVAPGTAALGCAFGAPDVRQVGIGVTSISVSCPAGPYTVAAAYCQTLDPTVSLTGSGPSTSTVAFCTWNNMGHSASSNVTTKAWCCQTPSVKVFTVNDPLF